MLKRLFALAASAALLTATIPSYAKVVPEIFARAGYNVEFVKMIDRNVESAFVTDEKGNRAKLTDHFAQGKDNLVVVWAHWCGFCQEEIKHIMAIMKQCGHENEAIFISSDRRDWQEDLKKFKSYKSGFKLLSVTPNSPGEPKYLVDQDPNQRAATPFNIIYDGRGMLKALIPGFRPESLRC